jgi:hypothetical protein
MKNASAMAPLFLSLQCIAWNSARDYESIYLGAALAVPHVN